MTETERNQIKGALLKCAEENENKFTLTGHIVVSSLCKSAVERIEELEKENAQLKKQQFSLRNERNTFLAQNEQYEKDLVNFNENLTKAKEILRKFLDAKSIEETCVAESEVEQFLKDSNIDEAIQQVNE